jgi:hypothetical protein
MTTSVTKSQLISAMETILQEYKDRNHSTMAYNCSLCSLYRHDWTGCDTKCPMFTFWDLGDDHDHPCMNRRCRPVNCYSGIKISKLNTKLNAVQEFYKKAIKKIKKMTDEEIERKDAFDFLIKLDNKIGDKYGLKMPVKIK